MSNKTTYRFYVNNKRVATAIFWERGSKHMSSILEVYPLQTQMIQPTAGKAKRFQRTFDSEAKWREHCLRDYVPTCDTRFEVVSSQEEPKEPPKPKTNWICPACKKGPGNDHRVCICRSFNYSVQAWEKACGIKN